MPRSVLFFIQFFLVALSILFLSHYFVYFSIVHFFSVTSASRKLILAAVLFLLPASFIASMVLGSRFEGAFFTATYFCSTLWLGVGLTLMTFFALAWAARGVTRLFTHSPSPALFGAAALVLTCLYSGYGIWNATHPRTEPVTVKIPNLPPQWRGRKAVQLSDVHLGRILGASFLEKLVERANAENPSVVFITGDLFDGRDGKLDQLVAPLNRLRAPLGIYFVTGNHETYLGTERAEAALKTTPVKILNDELVAVEGLQIVGIGYAERGASKDLGEVIRKLDGFDPRRASVLLYHSPIQIERVRAAGIGLQLAGHTHHGQIFPLQFVTRMIYGKYYNGLHTEGGYTIYTSSGAGVWGPMMRTGNHPEITVLRFE
jgi:uncharacterized protein